MNSAPKRKRETLSSPAKRSTDLLVQTPPHPLSERPDDELDADGSPVRSDDEDLVDPALKRRRLEQVDELSVEEDSFANNTGAFLPPEQGHAQGYTNLQQAMAEQPLAMNPSQQTIHLVAHLDQAIAQPATTDAERLDMFMETVKQQLYQISQRVDSLETTRFASNHSLTQIQSSLVQLESKFRFPTTVNSDTSQQILQALTATDQSHPQGHGGENGVSEAANVSSAHQLKDLIQSQMVEMSNGAATDEYKALHNSLTALNPFHLMSTPSASTSTLPPTPLAPKSTPAPTKRTKKGPSNDVEIDPTLTSKVEDGKPKKKARKPELSRVVRATMFKLLGLPIAANASKYHGYTSSPVLPGFNATISFDPETGARIWRWEWEKTIRQSTYNASFASAINQHITSGRSEGKYSDVPEKDWEALDDAIDSAYTNLRRERDSQVDPSKKMKKDEHRKRNKKRGLKEEKCRRRVKAHPDSKKIKDGSEAIVGPDGAVGVDGMDQQPHWTTEGDEIDILQSLELRYMSSEEELDMSDPTTLAIPYSEMLSPIPATLVANEKTFATYRPSWRSPAVVTAFAHLDSLRPPERSYKRVLGAPRVELPPLDTPDWMMSEEWRLQLEEKRSTLNLTNKKKGGKGKAKALDQD